MLNAIESGFVSLFDLRFVVFHFFYLLGVSKIQIGACDKS
jgi:hypothetical protein